MDEKTKKTLTSIIRGAIIGFVIGGVIIYFVVENDNLFFPFEDLNFEDNDYFEFQSSSLHSRDPIITTSERLVLSLGFTNKQPYSLTIEPEVYTWIGKLDHVKEILPTTTYGPNHGPTGKNNVFSAPVNEGENYFKVALKISYGNNGTFITYLNSTVVHNILSPESAIQERQSSMMFWSVIVAIFVGSGTVGALIWTNRISQREIGLQEAHIGEVNAQNDFLKEQSVFSDRAWIGATLGIQFHPEIQNRFLFHYKNYGKTPAFKVKENGGYFKTKPTKNQVKAIERLDIESLLVPQQEVQFGFNVPVDVIESSKRNETDLYYWITIKYKINGGNGEYGVIYHDSPSTNSFIVEEEWTDFE